MGSKRRTGSLEQRGRLLSPLPPEPADFGGHVDQEARVRSVTNEPRIVRRVTDRGREHRELAQPGGPADGLELAAPLKLCLDHNNVGRLEIAARSRAVPKRAQVAAGGRVAAHRVHRATAPSISGLPTALPAWREKYGDDDVISTSYGDG